MLQPVARTDFGVYEPRNPRASHYYRCVEGHFEQLEAVWDDRYAGTYGCWRPHALDVIYRYLDCGDLYFGFARVKCEGWVMNICWRFPAKGGIFVLPVIRSA
ncbi:MAG: hypothetical protein ABIL06_19275 [Pseudomonadota bacterium]